jgi:hypothetical protein
LRRQTKRPCCFIRYSGSLAALNLATRNLRGITNYLTNGATLETAAKIAGHRSTTTTQLYDRTREKVNQAEIERIGF